MQVYASGDVEQPGARIGSEQRCACPAHGVLHEDAGPAHLPPHHNSLDWCLRTPAPVCGGLRPVLVRLPEYLLPLLVYHAGTCRVSQAV